MRRRPGGLVRVVPSRLPVLDSALQATGLWYERVESTLSEADVDQLVRGQTALLADALRAANVIEPDSSLRFLGMQVDNVDVLLAEVQGTDDLEGKEAPDGWGPLRRLVLVEDKLLSNPEQKRQVLAQLLEYADRAEFGWGDGGLGERLPWASSWLTRNQTRLDDQLRRGEYLLMIVADEVGETLLRLARRFAAHDSPLTLSELCLVSMGIYQRDNGDRLLLPHVVSAVERSQRELTIQVRVMDQYDNPVAADVSTPAPAVRPSVGVPRRADVIQFLRGVRSGLPASDVGPGFAVTGKPRKILAYWKSVPGRAQLLYMVHFGGYARDVWSPVHVGFVVEAADQQVRDDWEQVLMRHSSQGRLPTGTVVRLAGPRTVAALVEIEWSGDSAALDSKLQQRIVKLLRQFVGTLAPEVLAWAP